MTRWPPVGLAALVAGLFGLSGPACAGADQEGASTSAAIDDASGESTSIPGSMPDTPATTPIITGPGSSSPPDAVAGLPAAGHQKVSLEVSERLADEGEVPVLVSLVGPSDVAAGDSGWVEAIAAAQQRVLAELDASEFRIRIAYTSVPALAGTILAPSALAVLDRHPDVLQVEPDPGGAGGG